MLWHVLISLAEDSHFSCAFTAALQNGREYGGNGSGVYCESGKGEEGVTQGGNAGVMHDMRSQRESGVFLSIGDFS